MSTIGPVGGASSYGNLPPDDAAKANNLRSGIASFSQSIRTGNPDSDQDVQELSNSILNLYQQISGK